MLVLRCRLHLMNQFNPTELWGMKISFPNQSSLENIIFIPKKVCVELAPLEAYWPTATFGETVKRE